VSAAPGTATRLEKAAIDNGFDRELQRDGDWLVYGSTHAPLQVWLTAPSGDRLRVALSRADVARGLTALASPVEASPPFGASVVLDVETIAGLTRLLRRAYQLARTLPHELLKTFTEKTASLPRSTEAERLVVQRVGQDVFREGLLEYWEGKCAVTGLAVPELLRASHIKPWAVCETDAERLDVFNGLLLAPHLDALFDAGFVTIAHEGAVVISELLTPEARALVGLAAPLRVSRLTDAHRHYLEWHRREEFRTGSGPAAMT
jgi:hypothetical protein